MVYRWKLTKVTFRVLHARQNRDEMLLLGFLSGPVDSGVAGDGVVTLRVSIPVNSQHAHFFDVLSEDHASFHLDVAKRHGNGIFDVVFQHVPARHHQAEPGIHMNDEPGPICAQFRF